MKDRTFAQEAKAMEFTINQMYKEKEYLEEQIQKYQKDRDRIRLQMVKHFIDIYEGY